MKIVKWILIIIAVLSVLMVVFSPYKMHDEDGYRSVKNSIVIHAAPEKIFAYLGNSSNAAHWSVYVDHIVTLNGDDVPDGNVGSIRRCYKQPDEKGIIWDEEITIVSPAQKRQLTIFNMQDFPMQANGLASEQVYEQMKNGKTRLSFTLFYKEPPSLINALKLYLAAYPVSNIFDKNLQNIKSIVEKGA